MKKVGEMVAKLGKVWNDLLLEKISTKNPVMNVLFDDLASSQVALVWDDMLRTVPLSDIKVNNHIY